MTAPSFEWTDRAVREALGLEARPSTDMGYAGITTDSRTASAGDLYVALRGERFNGHDFVADALASGCLGAVVSGEVNAPEGTPLYAVDDTLVGLGSLAGHRRRALPASVVGITGSVGKTTTKELVAAAVGTTRSVHATHANLNNRVGLPLTLLAAPVDAEVVVVELGSNQPGEIACLAEISSPDVAVITAVGESHLEKLGTLEDVLSEKLDLVRSLGEHGQAVVGDDPPALARSARVLFDEVRVTGWTNEADADQRPSDVEIDDEGRHRFGWKGSTVSMRLPGRHAVYNALLALAVAEILGVRPEAAARGIATVAVGALRGETRHLGELTLLLDCYNASPQSVRAALDLLVAQGRHHRRVAILGSMLELGTRSSDLHRQLLVEALDRGLDLVVATGDFSEAARDLGWTDRKGLLTALEPEAAYEELRGLLRGRELILLKASRGVALERLVPLFERDFGGAEA